MLILIQSANDDLQEMNKHITRSSYDFLQPLIFTFCVFTVVNIVSI